MRKVFLVVIDLFEELEAGLLLADVAHLDLDTVAKVAVQQVDQLVCRLVNLLRVHIGMALVSWVILPRSDCRHVQRRVRISLPEA